nr:extensin-like [Lolium perenne]
MGPQGPDRPPAATPDASTAPGMRDPRPPARLRDYARAGAGLAPPRKVHSPRGPDPGPCRRRKKNAARPRLPTPSPSPKPPTTTPTPTRGHTRPPQARPPYPEAAPRRRTEVARSLERDPTLA